MKKLVASGVCFLILLIGGVFFLFKKDHRKDVRPISNEPSVSTADNSRGASAAARGYMVKSYKGNIAVFEQGKDTPFRTTGVVVEELPPADRALLEKGIEALDQEELNIILEDYCS